MQFLTAGDAPELRPGRRGVLHELVLALRDLADITVFAVGDTDQSVYGFTGADAKYLTELADRADFRDLELEVNYRSGQDIITAAEATLGLPEAASPAKAHPQATSTSNRSREDSRTTPE
ncbi:UvrD-helicase domain-containing protein [Streptomyces sp. NPDC088184]|uniref:UvrD-helicase domain-containing protein n=1 Tax=unclassified Streptomyces TaxID=2593676 RepID=UPI0034357AA3